MLQAPQHLFDMVEFALAIALRVEDAVVDHPEPPGLGGDVHARDQPDAPDDLLLIAAPLAPDRLDVGTETLVQHGVVEDQVRLRIELDERLYLLP
jgi:hypothetical protein